MIYERLCKVSQLIPLLNRYKEGERRDLERAVKFLKPLMKISAEGVLAAARLMGILMTLLFVFLLLFLNSSILVATPLSLIVGVLTYYVVASYPINTMNSYKIELSEESDIIFEQFLLTFQSGGTIFDAFEMIANSSHPYLSKTFQSMMLEIDRGRSPEELLREFAHNQPSDDLRRYFIGVLSSLEQKTDVLEILAGESFEADLALRQKNLELESRILIVAAVTTYVPIMFALSFSLAGLASNPLIIFLAPLFIAINILMKSRFTTKFSAYFDRPQKSSDILSTQKEIVNEYDEFLNFLILLGERLRLGDTLEVALFEVRDDSSPEIQRLIDPVLEGMQLRDEAIEPLIEDASSRALGERVGRLFRIVSLMCSISARDAGDRISKIASRLIKRSAVVKERESIIAAQKIKVYILSITSAGVLGLLASLSPFLYIGELLSQGPNFTPGSISLLSVVPLLITLVTITMGAGYINTKMVNGDRPITISLLCGLLFWLSFSLSSGYLGFYQG